jgi:hypothetical protein
MLVVCQGDGGDTHTLMLLQQQLLVLRLHLSVSSTYHNACQGCR